MKTLHDKLKIQYLSIRGSTLYFLQAPLWLALPISLLRGRIFKSLAILAVITCFCYAASLTRNYYRQKRQQLLNEYEHQPIRDERRIAMGFVSLGVFILFIFITRRFMPIGLIAAALAALGYYLNYLFTPYTDTTTQPTVQTHTTAPTDEHLSPTLRQMLYDAHNYLECIRSAAQCLSHAPEDHDISQRLQQILHDSTIFLNEISKDSNRIRDARAFLVVHLRELAEISITYSNSHPDNKQQSRRQFSTLLDTIHTQLSARYHDLNASEQQRLNIQINVLQEQLERPQNHE